MKISSDEITSVIKKQIENYKVDLNVDEVGTVLEVGDGIAHVYGLENCMAGELLELPNGVYGMAMNLEESNVGAVLLGNAETIKEGDVVKRTGRLMQVPVGNAVIGRVVNALGQPIDGRGEIKTDAYRDIEIKAPGIADRQPVNVPLQTGLKCIDSMVPIGRGQRELIIGDRGTGKTAIAIDTILNQKGQDVICIYVSIGQKNSNVVRVYERLRAAGAMDYSIIVHAGASEGSPMQYLAPYSGVSIAEHFMHQGKDVLIIYDDLSKHAVAYRAMSLLLRRPPGREAYPGDVFYLHSRLLERAARLSDALGGGSITALPIIETLAGDVGAYIPTNVISITGFRPAVNAGLSVSRVGGSAQIKAMKQVAGTLRLDLAQFRELAAFAQFGSDLDAATKAQIDRGQRTTEILKQPQYSPYPVEDQVMAIYTAVKGYLDDVDVDQVVGFEQQVLNFLHSSHPEIGADIVDKKKLTDENEAKLREALDEFKKRYKAQSETEEKSETVEG